MQSISKELMRTARFSTWDRVKEPSAKSASPGSSELDEDSKKAGNVILGRDTTLSASDLVNVVLRSFTVSIDPGCLVGAGFVKESAKDKDVTMTAIEQKSAKGHTRSSSNGERPAAAAYSPEVCRAGLFARVQSLCLGRCGVRSRIVTLAVDMLNAGITPAFTSDEQAGKELCLALAGSDGASVYDAASGSRVSAKSALAAANLTPIGLSASEVETLFKGQFLCTGAACLIAAGASNAIKALEGISALSCEALGVSTDSYNAEQFEIARQHRGQINCALSMRLLLEGSKRTGTAALSGDAAEAFLAIPQIHGPAADAINSVVKAVDIELNSSELSAVGEQGIGLNPSQMLLALHTLSGAVHILSQACCSRLAALHGDSRPAGISFPVAKDTTDFAYILQQIAALSTLMRQELTQSLRILDQASAEADAGARGKRGGDDDEDGDRNPNKPVVDESSWTPAQRVKAEAARKKKEEKAAAKNAGKGSKKSGGLVLGAGTGTLYAHFSEKSAAGGGGGTYAAMMLDPFNTDSTAMAALCTSVIEKLGSGGKRKPKTAKGTRDYGPEQMHIREQVFQTIRRVFKRHGGVEIDTPVFELKEVLMGKYGEDTKLIYDLADQGGEQLALRYDLTVPFARFLAMNTVGNIKRYHIAKVYRRDQPQLNRGRYREFYQCDFDIAGAYSPMTADAEAITIACEILTTLPVGNICVKLNHRVLLDAIFEICGVPLSKFRPICSAVDKLDKAPWEEVRREMVEEKGLSAEVADKIGKFVLKTSKLGKPQELWELMMSERTFGDHEKANAAMEEMRILFTYLDAMGSVAYVSFDMSLARGLDYYTGLIYEIVVLDGTTSVGSISAGGRYDNLVGMFSTSGTQTPCVGISIGIERVFTIMEKKAAEKKLLSADQIQCYVASIGGNTQAHRMKIARMLWKSDISTEYSTKENPKLKVQMDECLERGIPFMAIFGESEQEAGIVKLKDMRARTESDVRLENLVEALLAAGCGTVNSSASSFLDKLKDAI